MLYRDVCLKQFSEPFKLIVMIILTAIPVMVQDAKSVALNINDPAVASRWRESNKHVILFYPKYVTFNI